MQLIWLTSLLFRTSFAAVTEEDGTAAISSPSTVTDDDVTSAPRIQPRIYGGSETKNGLLGGFVVQVFRNDKLVCTGTLLSPRHFLTAAHCFENSVQKEFHAVAGKSVEIDSKTLKKKNRLIQVRVHPKFNKTEFIADIAVAKVQYQMKSKYIGYAKVCKTEVFQNEFVTVAGWGRNEEQKNHTAKNILRVMKVPIMGRKNCLRKLNQSMPPNILCAGGYNKRTICDGDSGGPLIFQNEVCGVNTWTWKCGQSEKPDVYMSVLYYAYFIKSTMDLMGNWQNKTKTGAKI